MHKEKYKQQSLLIKENVENTEEYIDVQGYLANRKILA